MTSGEVTPGQKSSAPKRPIRREKFRAGAACRQTGGQETSLSCGAHGSAAKNWRNIIMKLSMKEKKILYAYGCPSHHNTVTRLKWLTALTVDPEAKRRMLGLARKVETEVDESWYEDFYHHLRMEMDEYRRLKRSLRVLKSYTDYEEDLYDEAV